MTPEARLRQRVRFPVLALTAAAWVGLLLVGMPMAGPEGSSPAGSAAAESAVQIGHGAAGGAGAGVATGASGHGAFGGEGALTLAGAPGSLLAHLVATGLMLTAMMAPLLVPALRHVLDRSLASRRSRAALLLTIGYTGTWAVAWVALVTLASALTWLLGAPAALAAGLLLAVVWQICPAKQRFLNRCHARPALRAFGSAADRGALGFGVRQAVACVGTCWALMLLPLLVTGYPLLAMAAVASWMWAERFEPPRSPSWRIRVPATSARIAGAQVRGRARLTPGLRSRA